MMAIIAKYGKLILLGLIVILALITVQRGCRLHYLENEYVTLKSQYDTLKKQADAELKKALEYIKTQDARIAEQNKLIELKDKEISEKYGNIDSLNWKISKLEEEYATLTDLPSQVANLKGQIIQWKGKCLSFESIIADKDTQLVAWREKFDAQIGISEAWRKRYDDEHALRLIAEDALKIQEKRVKALSFNGNVKSILILAVGGYVAYDIVRGK